MVYRHLKILGNGYFGLMHADIPEEETLYHVYNPPTASYLLDFYNDLNRKDEVYEEILNYGREYDFSKQLEMQNKILMALHDKLNLLVHPNIERDEEDEHKSLS